MASSMFSNTNQTRHHGRAATLLAARGSPIFLLRWSWRSLEFRACGKAPRPGYGLVDPLAPISVQRGKKQKEGSGSGGRSWRVCVLLLGFWG